MPSHSVAFDLNDQRVELQSASDWDVAIRFQELRKSTFSLDELKRLRTIATFTILRRARGLLGSLIHPTERKESPWTDLPLEAENLEINLEQTLDEGFMDLQSREEERKAFPTEKIWMSYRLPQEVPIVLMVDTSLSMTGSKFALTGVALALVAMEFQKSPLGILSFENQARVLKEPYESLAVESLIERFLSLPVQGYTHLEAGMQKGLAMVEEMQKKTARKESLYGRSIDRREVHGREGSELSGKTLSSPHYC
jgi:hypothetical protein